MTRVFLPQASVLELRPKTNLYKYCKKQLVTVFILYNTLDKTPQNTEREHQSQGVREALAPH
jgi:hypothetical protein